MPFMSDRRSDLVFQSSLVQVFDVTCHAPQSGCSGEELCSISQVVVPSGGVFLLHHRGVPIVADPNTALVFGMGDTYQVSHPVDGGDQCTVFVFSPDLVEDALGSAQTRHGTIHAVTQLSIHVLTHTMATGVTTDSRLKKCCLVLNALAQDFRSSTLVANR
jgi:hypothetical protein